MELIAIVKSFFKAKAKAFSLTAIVGTEKYKNYAIAKSFFDKIINRNLDIEFVENVDIEEYYKKLESVDFWVEVINFMFKYADENILKYNTQTINGVFLFYFKRYDVLKKQINSSSSEAENRKLLGLVRQWKKQNSIYCFYCFIVLIYKHFEKSFNCPNKQIYYDYIRYFSFKGDYPSVNQIVLQNDPLLRGLLLLFKDNFYSWMNIDGNSSVDSLVRKEIIDYEDLSVICNIKGALFDTTVTDKDLNDIIGTAMEIFVDLSNFEGCK